MYVSKLIIENFRNFQYMEVPLNQFTVLIGENDVGKTNIMQALNLLLYNNDVEYSSQQLSSSDLNENCVSLFYEYIYSNRKELKAKQKSKMLEVTKLIPKVRIRALFSEPKNEYEKSLLTDWLSLKDKTVYEVEYVFRPKNDDEFLEYFITSDIEAKHRSIPVSMYSHSVLSVNNSRRVRSDKYNNFQSNIIFAERDHFSNNQAAYSNRLISNIIEKNLNIEELQKLDSSYQDFFKNVKEIDSYKSIFNSINKTKVEGLKQFIKEIDLVPNFPNLRNILSNVNIGYGSQSMYQQGLGKRNFVFILFLLSYYLMSKNKFTLIGIEEPEAHLDSGNLNVLNSFFESYLETQSSLNQTVITSHIPEIVNKLRLHNVVVVTNDKCISLSGTDDSVVNYLSRKPNFDILKFLLSKRVILVEGITEELLIRTILRSRNTVNQVDVICVGHRGFRSYMDIWLILFKGDASHKLGVVRDFDNLKKSKADHELYDSNHSNITVRTTKRYTFEDEFVYTGENCKILNELFGTNETENELIHTLKTDKAGRIIDICQAIDGNSTRFAIPKYIEDIISELTK